MDLRYALRRLARSPGFTIVAVLSLALGIGANTAVFSLVNAVLLREPPVADHARLVEVYTSDESGAEHATFSVPDFRDLRASTGDVFEDVTAHQLFFGQTQVADAEPALVIGTLVTGNFFDLLGVRMALGRGFEADVDAVPGAHPVVVLAHDYWRAAFAGDPAAIGATLRINRRSYTVVGVAADGFRGLMPGLAAEVFVPMSMVNVLMPMSTDRLEARGSRSSFVTGRLRDGVSLERAQAAVATIAARLAADHPRTNDGRRMSVLRSSDVAVHPAVDGALLPVAALLLGVVALVLLIACVNLASFLLARAADRRREVAIRLALGAERWHLVRQLLVESVILALLGGLAGTLLARWTIDVFVAFQPPIPIPINLDIPIDLRVLAFTALVSVVAGLLFGLVPALQATNPDVAPTLKAEASSVTGVRRRFDLRNTLVVVQVAFSLLLLVGSGLFVRSLGKAQAIDPGFYTGSAAILWPNYDLSGFDDARAAQLRDELRTRLSALPGVTGVAMADRLPLGIAVSTRSVNIEGVDPQPGRTAHDLDFAWADESYLPTLDIPVRSGRNFTIRDDLSSPAVAIVSETMARRFWPDGDALGGRLYLGEQRSPVTVVGIAADTKVRTLGEAPRPYLYLPLRQHPGGTQAVIVVRGTLPSSQLLAAARRTALEADPQLVLMEAKTMEQHLAFMLFPPRMAALLLSVLGGIALVMAAIGLYGLVSHAVARRTREMGIRMALGARTADVIRLAAGGGIRLVLIGTAAGMALAAAVSWLIAGFLYGIRATDALTFVAIPLTLAAIGALASWIPARRAARADPVTALRSD